MSEPLTLIVDVGDTVLYEYKRFNSETSITCPAIILTINAATNDAQLVVFVAGSPAGPPGTMFFDGVPYSGLPAPSTWRPKR